MHQTDGSPPRQYAHAGIGFPSDPMLFNAWEDTGIHEGRLATAGGSADQYEAAFGLSDTVEDLSHL